MKNKLLLVPMAAGMQKYAVMLIPLTLVVMTGVTACGEPRIGTRQLAIDLTAKIKDMICPVGYLPSQPCNGKDVRFDADLGTIAYINIYGVTDETEMGKFTNFATKFRNERDKHIFVQLTFYTDLTKSHEIKTIKIRGN